MNRRRSPHDRRAPVQGVDFDLRLDGDISVVVTTVNGGRTIITKCVMSQLDFCRKALPIVRQYSNQHRDGITDALPPPEGG